MKDTLSYGEFLGSVHFSAEDDCFYGRIEGISDLVSFEGKDVEELKRAFRESIEDYIGLCRRTGKALHKSYKGSFNVRLAPDLHKKAVQRSLVLGISLNQFVQRAIENELRILTP